MCTSGIIAYGLPNRDLISIFMSHKFTKTHVTNFCGSFYRFWHAAMLELIFFFFSPLSQVLLPQLLLEPHWNGNKCDYLCIYIWDDNCLFWKEPCRHAPFIHKLSAISGFSLVRNIALGTEELEVKNWNIDHVCVDRCFNHGYNLLCLCTSEKNTP